MNTIIFNLEWMSFNVFLAIVAVAAGFFMFRLKNIIAKFLFGIIWIIFIPNTIYMLTDLIHIPKQIRVENNFLIIFIILFQYFLLIFISIITFILALYPFEKMTFRFINKQKKRKIIIYLPIFIIHFLIALGVGLGRFQRLNSWEVFTNTEFVITQTVKFLNSSEFFIVFLFGLISNIIYFSLRKAIIKKLLRIS